MIIANKIGCFLIVASFVLFPITVSAGEITTFSAAQAYYHYTSGTIVFTEAIGDDIRLAVINKAGKKKVLDTYSTKLESNNCAKVGDINISPRGWLAFVQLTGCVEGGSTEIFDLRTGKTLQLAEDNFLLFNPKKDVFFSKDASRMAIRTEGSELMGTLASIYIQDPKTLKLISIASIDLDEYAPVYERYGDDARLTFDNITFNMNKSVTFAKVVKSGTGKVLKSTRTTYRFAK